MRDGPAYRASEIFERGGTVVAVIGQAFSYMPIANPRWMFPDLSFGIREDRMAEVVGEVRAAGAEAVVLLSHNGFGVDRKMASRVQGIAVILTGHPHDALPGPVMVERHSERLGTERLVVKETVKETGALAQPSVACTATAPK